MRIVHQGFRKTLDIFQRPLRPSQGLSSSTARKPSVSKGLSVYPLFSCLWLVIKLLNRMKQQDLRKLKAQACHKVMPYGLSHYLCEVTLWWTWSSPSNTNCIDFQQKASQCGFLYVFMEVFLGLFSKPIHANSILIHFGCRCIRGLHFDKGWRGAQRGEPPPSKRKVGDSENPKICSYTPYEVLKWCTLEAHILLNLRIETSNLLFQGQLLKFSPQIGRPDFAHLLWFIRNTKYYNNYS